jgi:hypothetical protein
VKIGDLVKYNKAIIGMEGCVGIIIGYNGAGVDVQWIDRFGYDRSTELVDMLEVLSENR